MIHCKDFPFEELPSVEVKPYGMDGEVEIIQLNKNIRVNKDILDSAMAHMGSESNDTYTIGMDVVGKIEEKKVASAFADLFVSCVGLDGFLYGIKPYLDIIAPTKFCEKNIFLPRDNDEIGDFLKSNTMDQSLSYAVSSFLHLYTFISS